MANERDVPASPVQIPLENRVDFRVDRPISVMDLPATEIQTGLPPYAPVAAGGAAEEREKALRETPRILVFNAGHAEILYAYGLIDENNLYKVTDKKGNTTIYAGVDVEWLLELAQFGENERRKEGNPPISDDPSIPQSYFGVLAWVTYQQLNQVSLKTKSDILERSLGPRSLARKLADHRRTPQAIRNYARSVFIAEEKAQRRMVKSSRWLMERLNQICPSYIRNTTLDPVSIQCLDDLEKAVAGAEIDLQTPRPPSTMP